MGSFRQLDAASTGSYRALDKPDARTSKAYETEKAKARARDKLRDRMNTGSMGALSDALGEPLPVGDEIRGGMFAAGNAAMNLIRKARGEEPVDSRAIYLANKDAENEHRAQRNAEHPIASGVGSVLGGLAAAPTKVAAAPAAVPALRSAAEKVGSFLAGSAKAGAGGGLFASLYGAAEGEGADRLRNARDNFLPGMVAGQVLHGVGSAAVPVIRHAPAVIADAARAFTKRPPPPGVTPTASPRQAEQAAQAVERLAVRRGLTPDKVREIASETFQGKPATAAEIIGREGVSQLAATARRGGGTADELESQLLLRQRGAPGRIMEDFQNDLGVSPATAHGDIQAIVDKNRAAAAPLYKEAYAAGGIDTPGLVTLVNRPSMRAAIGRAVRIAAEEGREPAELGFRTVQTAAPKALVPTTKSLPIGNRRSIVRQTMEPAPGPPPLEDFQTMVENPTAQTWDYVKRGLDDVLNSKRDAFGKLHLDEEGRAILETLNKFRGELTTANPAYARALEHSGDYLSTESALRRGKGALTRGDLRDFGKLWASAKGEAEKDALRAAIATDVQDLANAGHLRGGKFAIPGIQQKLELAFGRDGAQKFLAKMEAEATLAKTGQRMMPGNGSPTYELAEAGGQDNGLVDIARITAQAGKGDVWSALLNAGAKAIAWAKTSGQPVEVRDEYGRLLRMSADELAHFLETRQPKAIPQARGEWALPATVGGQLGAASQ